MAESKQQGERTLEIETEKEGKFRITIPANWKVTFGPFAPGSPHAQPSLRIYESENHQRACFVGVRQFRDVSLPMQRLNKTKKEEAKSKSDNKGRQDEREVEVEEKWEDL